MDTVAAAMVIFLTGVAAGFVIGWMVRGKLKSELLVEACESAICTAVNAQGEWHGVAALYTPIELIPYKTIEETLTEALSAAQGGKS